MSSFRILPATQTMAALQPHMLTIELPTFASADVARAQAGGSDPRPLEIVAHELCHWFDIVGTVWGQEYLNDLFHALDRANDPVAREAAFAPAIKLFDADRAVLFPTYYKYVKADAPSDTGPGRWRMEVTSGTRIATFGVPREDDPILFVHFSTREKDIGRQPLSVGSLLELRAVYAELAAYLQVSRQWSDEERAVGHALFSRRVLASMYEPQLITYSAAAHFIGRALGEGDVGQVLKLGSLLADFALNLTPESFARMRTAQQMGGGDPSGSQVFVLIKIGASLSVV